MINMQRKILVIDDKGYERVRVGTPLRQAGCQIVEADSLENALDVFARERPEAVFCDYRLKD